MWVRQAFVWFGLLLSAGCVPHSEPSAATAPAAPAPSAPSVAQAPPPAVAPAAPAAPVPPAANVAATPTPEEPGAALPAAAPPAGNAPPAADPATTAPPAAEPPADKPGERTAAKAGVGKQGQSLKEHSGVIVEAAKAYFNVRQRAVFEIQIPEALKLYEATEGRKPRTHEEFMAKVIAANSINLPTLPAGDKYVYDPERGELMVEKRPR